jgi:predicted secreted protein
MDISFIISFLLVFLYTILILLDVNKIADQYRDNKNAIIFNYLLLYIIILFKILISLITAFTLVLIIRVILTCILSLIFDKINIKNDVNGVIENIENKYVFTMKKDLESNVKLFLSFIYNFKFVLVFFIIIPVLLFILLLIYRIFCNFNDDVIVSSENNSTDSSYDTHNKFIIMCMITMIIMGLLYNFITMSQLFENLNINIKT